MGFAEDIEKFAMKMEVGLDEMVRALLIKMNDLVVTRTPVDTGQARGGWVATIDQPSASLGNKDKTGNRTKSKANRVVANAYGRVYFLVNNVNHIRFLEYGSSDQAPGGMVRISIREVKNDLQRQLRVF